MIAANVHSNQQPVTMFAEWSQRVGGFTAVPALIRQMGLDPGALLDDVGLARDSLEEPEQRVPYAAIGALLHAAARLTKCPHFGLLCGRAWHLSHLGRVGELMRNSPTVGEALQTLTAHQHLHSDGGLAFLLEHGGVVDLGYAVYQPGVVGADQIYDAMMAGGCNFLRELLGADWTPSEVHFPLSKPWNVEPYRHLFRAPLRFDSEFCALRFHDHQLAQLVRGADPLKLHLAEHATDSVGRGELLPQVYGTLRVQLLSGHSSGDAVAEELAMHRRTLNRRLEQQGVTFRGVLDQVRFEVAGQLLADSHMPIDDIAATLGYASVSPFMRSFRRWSGTTPGRWRRAADRR